MGSFCCCPCVGELEEYAYSNNSMYRNCTSLRIFFYQLFSGYTAMFHRLEGRPAASPIQGTTSLSSTIVPTMQDGCQGETHPTVPRAFPYDPDQRYCRLQRDGLVSRRDKSLTQFQEEQQPLRRNASSSGTESMGLGKKRTVVGSDEDSIVSLPESPEKVLATNLSLGLSYLQTSSEDEDVCPTCFDEYTPENPKITTRCSHHFHLCCIYEWLERSESCPICGKEMEFCESP